MQTFTEENLRFSKVDAIGSIAMTKRVRTIEPHDCWYVVDQTETCDGYRKRTTRTHGDFATANSDYQNRLARMKTKGVS